MCVTLFIVTLVSWRKSKRKLILLKPLPQQKDLTKTGKALLAFQFLLEKFIIFFSFLTTIYPDKDPVYSYSSDLLLPELSGGRSPALEFQPWAVVWDSWAARISKPSGKSFFFTSWISGRLILLHARSRSWHSEHCTGKAVVTRWVAQINLFSSTEFHW